MRWLFALLITASALATNAQTWVDTLDLYARTEYRPANKYKWTWVNAALLSVMVNRYDRGPEADKATYLAYVKTAMDHTYKRARGKTPNGVASGLGMAFLYRVTKDEKYLKKSLKIYEDYLNIKRTPNGGVSHLRLFYELWDDTVFMIGEYLMQMYLATGEEKYLDEFMSQFRIHREQLRDTTTNLWVHGWDADSKAHPTFCSQNKWQNHPDRRSKEFWGRGNGWIIVTLSDALQNIPKDHKHWPEFAAYLKEMVEVLPVLQDSATGHWYQLPLRKGEAGNYLESSCTAMFAYGILTAQKLGIVTGPEFTQAVDRAYKGLPEHSLVPVSGGFLTTQNVCKGTCIGDSKYYYARKSQQGKPYAVGMFMQFGWAYENRTDNISYYIPIFNKYFHPTITKSLDLYEYDDTFYRFHFSQQLDSLVVEQFDSTNKLLCRLQFVVRNDVLSKYIHVIDIGWGMLEKVVLEKYRQPLLNGEQLWYHDNGNVSRREWYIQGVSDSIWTYYDTTGNILRTEERYRDWYFRDK